MIVYGDRFEFRDGAPTADGVLLLVTVGHARHDDVCRWISRAEQVHFRGSRLQPGSSCFVVVKLVSLVVSRGGYRPPANATNQCSGWKAT